jgi:putative polyhydroxyalkanoate system protein
LSNISIRRMHNLEHAEAVRAANRVAEQLESEHGIRSHWDGDVMHFERSSVEGTLRVTPKTLHLEVKLGFLLALFHDTIEREIQQTLDNELGGKPSGNGRRRS